MSLMELIPLAILATYAAFAMLEALRPGRAFPEIARWRFKGAFFLVFGLALTMCCRRSGRRTSRLSADRRHRARHVVRRAVRFPGARARRVRVAPHACIARRLLCRALHQMHHSAERIDIWGSLYFHPLDLTVFAFVYSFMLVVVAGVTRRGRADREPDCDVLRVLPAREHPHAAAGSGYIIQRPEAHSLHHERGVHGYNYSDLPLWDIVFGTFRNPAGWNAKAGYYDGASARIPEMLIGVDVVNRAANAKIAYRSRPRLERASLHGAATLADGLREAYNRVM